MRLTLVGVNHQTAPVAVRERFAIPSHALSDRLTQARAIVRKLQWDAARGASDAAIQARNDGVLTGIGRCQIALAELEQYCSTADQPGLTAALEKLDMLYYDTQREQP